MAARVARRDLLKRAAALAGATAGTYAFGMPALLAEPSPNSKLGFAVIGCGGRSGAHLPAAAAERLVAVSDPDESRTAGAIQSLSAAKLDVAKTKSYFDYRRMFDEIHKQIDGKRPAEHVGRSRRRGPVGEPGTFRLASRGEAAAREALPRWPRGAWPAGG